MQLVILAAGHGRRFGGLKQLAAVGPNGEAIMDYTALAARDCGYDGVVLVVRPEIEGEVRAHVAANFPTGLPVELVHQGPRRGTAEAVFSASSHIDGPFAVANADDLYGADPLQVVHQQFVERDAPNEGPHLLVGYQLGRTILTARSVTRGLIEVGEDDELTAIVENSVNLRDDGRFEATPIRNPEAPARVLDGTEHVSMNLWGFGSRIFDDLSNALDERGSTERELLLPEVVGELMEARRERVQVAETLARCIGITNPEDLALVKDELAIAPSPLGTTPVR